MSKAFKHIDALGSAIEAKFLLIHKFMTGRFINDSYFTDSSKIYEDTVWSDLRENNFWSRKPWLVREISSRKQMDFQETEGWAKVLIRSSLQRIFVSNFLNEAIDTCVECISTRFQSQAEKFMIKAVFCSCKQHLWWVSWHYKDELDRDTAISHRYILLDMKSGNKNSKA